MCRYKYLLLIVLFLGACKQSNNKDQSEKGAVDQAAISFESIHWQTREKGDYPFRTLMLDDLMDSDTLRLMNREQVITLLGPPDRTDGEYLFYRIKQKRIGLWPLHTTTLVIELSTEKAPNKIMIHK